MREKPVEKYIREFHQNLVANGYAKATIERYVKDVRRFADWCSIALEKVTAGKLDEYRKFVMEGDLSLNVKWHILMCARIFFAFVQKRNYVLFNPAENMELPKMPHSLPRSILSKKEVNRLLALPDTKIPLGIRDRAIMEVLYACGLRNGELCTLTPNDINFEEGVLFIKDSKHNANRYVPISPRALDWIKKYLAVRSDLLSWGLRYWPKNRALQNDCVFISERGRPMTTPPLGFLVARYFRRAKIEKRGGAYLFRHTLATRMLENGADIRYIQKMLGHENIATTQIYTRVSLAKLKEIYRKTHPREIGGF